MLAEIEKAVERGSVPRPSRRGPRRAMLGHDLLVGLQLGQAAVNGLDEASTERFADASPDSLDQSTAKRVSKLVMNGIGEAREIELIVDLLRDPAPNRAGQAFLDRVLEAVAQPELDTLAKAIGEPGPQPFADPAEESLEGIVASVGPYRAVGVLRLTTSVVDGAAQCRMAKRFPHAVDGEILDARGKDTAKPIPQSVGDAIVDGVLQSVGDRTHDALGVCLGLGSGVRRLTQCFGQAIASDLANPVPGHTAEPITQPFAYTVLEAVVEGIHQLVRRFAGQLAGEYAVGERSANGVGRAFSHRAADVFIQGVQHPFLDRVAEAV